MLPLMDSVGGRNLIFPIGKEWVMDIEKLRYFIVLSFIYQYVAH